MIVPFVIDADSIDPEPSWSPAQIRASHNAVLDVLQSKGLLVYDGDSFEHSRLYSAVQKLPQNIRPLWMAVLTKVPLCPCRNGWNGTVERANLNKFSATANLAIVDDTRAEIEFGILEDCDEVSIAITEDQYEVNICRLIAINQAKQFKRAHNLSQEHIEPHQTYQETWESRFKTLANAPIKKITIVDRFALSNQFECPEGKISGLERFLKLLDRDASGDRHVTFYSTRTYDFREKTIKDAESILKKILKSLPNKNIKRIKLHLAHHKEFGDKAHDRFIRFENYIWDFGQGLKIFDGAYARERSSSAFKSGDAVESYKKIEKELADHRNTEVIEIS